MATNTGGGTTTSLNYTPQAKDDFYTAGEDQILYFSVMDNDLGGAAKVLWSIDNTSDDGSTDLVAKDVAGVCEYSELGARISLTSDGRIKYDTTLLDGLAEGETVTDQFTYAIRLSNGTLSWATVTVTLTGTNDAPVANVDTGAAGENEDKAFDVLANDTDVDGGAVLTLQSIDGVTVDGVAASAGEEAAFAIAGNQIQFSPGTAFDHLAEGDSATVVVTYTITDEHGATSTSTLTLTVTGSNDGPVANADEASTSENAAVLVDVLANDTDVDDGHSLTVVSASAPAGQGSASVVGNQVEFDPGTDFDHLPEGESVTVTVSYTIEDEHGATSSSTIEITVTGTNDIPELSASLTEHNFLDTSGDDSFGNVSGSLSTDDPDDGDTATYSVNGGVADDSRPGFDSSSSNAYGTLYLDSATGAYEFVPNDGAIEGLKSDDSVSFTLTVTDGEGASDSETLTINLDGANDTPEAPSTNSVTMDEDNPSAATAIGASDRDTGEALTYSVKSGAEPGHGSVSFDQAAGTFVYTPDANYHGSDSFTVLVTDASGATTEQVVDVTVNSVNDAPEAAGTNSVTTDEDNASAATAIGASDVDGDTLTYSVKSGGEPAHGSVSFDQVAGTFVYTPDADFNGSDSFIVLIDDGNGGTAEQVVSVTVNPVNDAPVSANGSNSTDEDQPLNGTLPAATDVDGDSVTYALDTDASNGTAVVNADGTFSYTPDPDFNGSDSFTFTVSDGNGGSNTYTYDVTVNPVNDAAVITGDDSGTIVEDAVPNTVGGNLNSTDVDGDDDSWNAVASATASANGYGTYTIDAAGNWLYTLDNSNPDVDALNNGGTLSDSFTVTTADGTSQLVTITINGHTDFTYTSPPLSNAADEHDFDNEHSGSVASGLVIMSPPGPTGANTIEGSNGHDTIYAGTGSDQVYGHDGADRIYGENGADISLYGQRGDDTIYGGNGGDQIFGGSGNDTIYGNSNPDSGGDAGDTIYGGSGRDTIYGQGGDDIIIGGTGQDLLTGGDGADTFVYEKATDTGDFIFDFQQGSDKIDLTAFGLDAGSFIGELSAAGEVGAGEFGYMNYNNGSTTVTTIYVDTDGAYGADLEITIVANLDLTGGDFLI